MADQKASPSGPDLTRIALSDFIGGRLVGHVGDEEMLLDSLQAELAMDRAVVQ